jgi:hypothetical protein
MANITPQVPAPNANNNWTRYGNYLPRPVKVKFSHEKFSKCTQSTRDFWEVRKSYSNDIDIRLGCDLCENGVATSITTNCWDIMEKSRLENGSWFQLNDFDIVYDGTIEGSEPFCRNIPRYWRTSNPAAIKTIYETFVGLDKMGDKLLGPSDDVLFGSSRKDYERLVNLPEPVYVGPDDAELMRIDNGCQIKATFRTDSNIEELYAPKQIKSIHICNTCMKFMLLTRPKTIKMVDFMLINGMQVFWPDNALAFMFLHDVIDFENSEDIELTRCAYY